MSTKPCKFYAQGKCKYGNKCSFAHINKAVSSFCSPDTLDSKTRGIREDIGDYKQNKFQTRPFLSSYGLGSPAVNNLIAGRDLSFEEQRLQYIEAQAQNKVGEYEKMLEARVNDMKFCIDQISGREQIAARYQQRSAENPNSLPKPFIEPTVEENVNRFLSQPSGFGTSGSTSGAFGLQPPKTTQQGMSSSPFGGGGMNTQATSSAFGSSGFGNSGNAASSGFGSSGFGSSGFGKSAPTGSAFGNSAFGSGGSAFGSGSAGFGNTASKPSAFGNTSTASTGFGSSGFGNSGFGSSGFGSSNTQNNSSAFGKSGFGSSGFGSNGDKANTSSGFGSSGFGGSGFGSGGFGSKPSTESTAFGNSGFGAKTQPSTGFGASASPFGNTAPNANTNNSPFGALSTSNTNTSPFGQAATANNNTNTASPFGASPFASQNTASNLPFGSNQASNNSPFSSVQGHNSQPFGSSFGAAHASANNINNLGSGTPFGVSSSTNNNMSTQPLNSTKIDESLDEMNPDVVAAFRAEKFELGKVPEVPPPISLC